MVAPSSTSVSTPSMLTLTNRFGSPTNTASAIDHRELGKPGHDRVRGGLAQPADRGVAHRLRDVAEQRDVRVLAVGQQPVEDLLLPDGPDTARHALAARLVSEEARDAEEDLLQVGGVVEHDDGAGTERGPYRPRPFEAQRHVELLLSNKRSCRTSQQQGLKGSPLAQPTGDVDERSQGGAHRDLVETGHADVPREAEKAGARRVGRAGRGKSCAAFAHDVQHVHQRLDIVDERGLAEEPGLDREWRLVARLAALSLDRVEKRGLLSADIGPRAAPDLDFEIEKSFGGGLRNRVFNPMARERVFAPDVQITLLATRRESGDRHRLDNGERITLQELPVLEGPGLGFVRIAHEVMRAGGSLRHRVPLAPARKRGAATTQQPGVGQLTNHTLRTKLLRTPKRDKTTMLAIALNTFGIDNSNAPQQPPSPRRGEGRGAISKSHPGRACAQGGGPDPSAQNLLRDIKSDRCDLQLLMGCTCALHQRRRRPIAQTKTRAAMPFVSRRANRPLERRAKLAGSRPLAGDVLAHMERERRPCLEREAPIERVHPPSASEPGR